MKWQPYPGYKPSGVEWLGGIPEDWEIFPVKHLAGNHVDVVQTGPFGAQLHASDYVDEGVPLILIRNVNNSMIDTSDIPKISEEKANSLGMYRLKEGDIVFSRVGSIGRIALITKNETGWLISGQMLRLRINNPILDKIFSIYAFSCDEVLKFVQLQSVGSTRESINTDILRNMPIPIPSLREQRAIAAFLDRETGRIDALMEKKQRQIELLQEKRAALISHAVTKGLDPTVSLKDSGVEWLREIPDTWPVMRLRFRAKINPSKAEINGMPGDTAVSFVPMEAVSEYGGLRLDETKLLDEVANGYTYFREGDVVVAKITPCFENWKGSMAEDLENGLGFGTTELHVIRAAEDLDRRYLFYLTITHAFRNIGASYMYGAGGQKRVPDDFVRNFRHPFPYIEEQRAIAAFLDRGTGRIDAMMGKVRVSIEKLKEYRTALISAAVTGQIDVSGEVRKASAAFPRIVLAAEIVDRLHDDPNFGRVKFQKTLYLCEHHLGMDLEGNYWRQAAGPLDNRMLYSLENQIQRQKWFGTRRDGQKITYVPLEKAGWHRKYFDDHWADYREGLDSLLEVVRPLNTERAEIVATLFAAWNDLIIGGVPFNDEDILHEVKSNWHESKERFDEDRLRKALQWMRDRSLIPRGLGRATRT